MSKIETVLWDLGGVLIEWDPNAIFSELIPDDEERTWFLANVCTREWNEEQDRGRSIAEGNAERVAMFPEQRRRIEAYYGEWERMLIGEVEGSRALLHDVQAIGIRTFALTNWSHETWPRALNNFPWLKTSFAGVVVSGQEGVKKPDSAIFNIAIERFALDPETTLFVDDVEANVAAASALGMRGHHFTSAQNFRMALNALGCAV